MVATSREELAVEIRGLTKTFGRMRAVSDMDLTIRRGEVFGLLGPNGSGKTTTMRMTLGLIKPDYGSVRVYGVDVSENPIEVRRMVGYVPEEPRLYEYLTGIEYLDFIADVRGLPTKVKEERIKESIEAFQLEGRENDMISGYSHGMKQKVAIIAALLHKPKLLILDEPLSGLDPRAARILKDLLQRMSTEEGVTTLFSTHVMEVADAVCNRAAIMFNGYVLAVGTVAELREKAELPGSSLEDVFLKLTGAVNMREIIEELLR